MVDEVKVEVKVVDKITPFIGELESALKALEDAKLKGLTDGINKVQNVKFDNLKSSLRSLDRFKFSTLKTSLNDIGADGFPNITKSVKQIEGLRFVGLANNVREIKAELSELPPEISTANTRLRVLVRTMNDLNTAMIAANKTLPGFANNLGSLGRKSVTASRGLKVLATNLTNAGTPLAPFSANLASASASLRGFKVANTQASESVKATGLSLGQAASAFAGFKIAQGTVDLIKTGTDFNLLKTRIQVLGESIEDVPNRFDLLFKSAQESGTPVSALADVYNRAGIAAKGLGLSSDDLTVLIDNLGKISTASGSTVSQLQAGLVQFGQALSQGSLFAQEFNSLNENIPLILQVVAKSLGTNTAELIKLSKAGEALDAKTLVGALLQATDDINKKFTPLANTLPAQLNRLSNTFQNFVSNAVESTGLLDKVGEAIRGIQSAIESGQLDINGFLGALVDLTQGFINSLPAIAKGITTVSNGIGVLADVLSPVVDVIKEVINTVMLFGEATGLTDGLNDLRRVADLVTNAFKLLALSFEAASKEGGSFTDTLGPLGFFLDSIAASLKFVLKGLRGLVDLFNAAASKRIIEEQNLRDVERLKGEIKEVNEALANTPNTLKERQQYVEDLEKRRDLLRELAKETDKLNAINGDLNAENTALIDLAAANDQVKGAQKRLKDFAKARNQTLLSELKNQQEIINESAAQLLTSKSESSRLLAKVDNAAAQDKKKLLLSQLDELKDILGKEFEAFKDTADKKLQLEKDTKKKLTAEEKQALARYREDLKKVEKELKGSLAKREKFIKDTQKKIDDLRDRIKDRAEAGDEGQTIKEQLKAADNAGLEAAKALIKGNLEETEKQLNIQLEIAKSVKDQAKDKLAEAQDNLKNAETDEDRKKAQNEINEALFQRKMANQEITEANKALDSIQPRLLTQLEAQRDVQQEQVDALKALIEEASKQRVVVPVEFDLTKAREAVSEIQQLATGLRNIPNAPRDPNRAEPRPTTINDLRDARNTTPVPAPTLDRGGELPSGPDLQPLTLVIPNVGSVSGDFPTENVNSLKRDLERLSLKSGRRNS